MKTNKNNEINALFFCKKCNSIPLIEIVPKESELKLLLSCKCFHQQLIKQETFFKYYYNNNYMKIETENRDIKNEKIKLLIKNYEEYKKHFMKNLCKIKEEINNKLKEAIKSLESMIDSYKLYNDNIDKVIKIIIKNYEINPNDNNNKENIIKNIQINSYFFLQKFDCIKTDIDKNISDLNKKVFSYLKDNYIISCDKYQLFKTLKKNDLTIELNTNIFASVKKNESIIIFNIKNILDFIKIDKNVYINNLLTDEKKRYLISVEDHFLIKFRDLNEIIKILNDQNYLNKDKSFPFLPLFDLKHDNKILNIINLENNLLGLCDEKSFNIYQYDVDNRNSELINKLQIKIDNLKLIKRKDKKYICFYKNYCLFLYEIPSLINKNVIKISQRYNSKMIYEQINENEIIFVENNAIKIINMDSNNYYYISKKLNFDIMSIKVLKDNTILIGGRSEIKRLFMKTLEELPCLISFNDDYLDYDEDYYYTNLNRDENDVLYINELSDGKIMLVLNYDIKIYALNYIDYI